MVQTSPYKDSLHAGTPAPMPYALFGWAASFFGIALFLVAEINVTVLRRFKRRRGLYFWSLLATSWGISGHTLGYIFAWWVPGSPWIFNTACILFGWSMMVTGQSLVLYSRLHLVIRNRDILRASFFIMIVTFFAIEIPGWVTTWPATDPKVTEEWSYRDSIMVRVTQLAFPILESYLCILYILGIIKLLAPNDKINSSRVKRDLFLLNGFIIALDIINIVLAYTNEHFGKEPTQNFAAAVKLKVEFIVLNQLMEITTQTRYSSLQGGGRYAKHGSGSNTNAKDKKSSTGDSQRPRKSGETDPFAMITVQNERRTVGSKASSPSMASSGSTAYEKITEPASAFTVNVNKSLPDDPLPARKGGTTHFEEVKVEAGGTLATCAKMSSLDSLALRYDPITGDMVREGEPKGYWGRMWQALPTGEETREMKERIRVLGV